MQENGAHSPIDKIPLIVTHGMSGLATRTQLITRFQWDYAWTETGKGSRCRQLCCCQSIKKIEPRSLIYAAEQTCYGLKDLTVLEES